MREPTFNRKLVEHVRDTIRFMHGQGTESFNLAEVYKIAELAAASFPLHASVAARHGVMRRMLQDERRKCGLIFIEDGTYQYPLTLNQISDSETNNNTSIGVGSMKHRSVKELLRNRAGKAFSPTSETKTETETLIEGNAKAVQSLGPKKCEPVNVPAAQVRQWKGLFGEDGGEDGEIEVVWLRPSEFVANIADPAKPGEGYQRNPKARKSKLMDIARKFHPALLGLFHSWVNENGQDELIDGLGRTFTCLHLLATQYNEPVQVWRHKHIKNVRQAALWFKRLNPDETTKVNDGQKFRASLTEKDPHALAMQKQAESGGLVIGGSGRNGISVQAAETLFLLGVLAETGRVKTAVWGDFKLEGPQYIGLGGYLKATNDNKASVARGGVKNGISLNLLTTLTKNGPDALATFANQKIIPVGANTHARVRAAAFARAILNKRNMRLQDRRRAKADWSIVDEALAMKPFTDRWTALV